MVPFGGLNPFFVRAGAQTADAEDKYVTGVQVLIPSSSGLELKQAYTVQVQDRQLVLIPSSSGLELKQTRQGNV